MTEPDESEKPSGTSAEGVVATSAAPAPAGFLDPDLARELGVGTESPRLLEPGEIRARRRPRAILFVWIWEILCALLLATPVHTWAKGVWSAHPDGDAVLFRPGGHELLTWLADGGPAFAIVLRTTVLMLVIFGILGQVITGALVAFLATGTGKQGASPPASFALRAGGAAFFPLLGIALVFGAIQAFVVGIGLLTSSSLEHALEARLGDARAFTAHMLVLALFVLVALLVGVLGDLARVTIARDAAMNGARAISLRRALRDGIVSAVTTARRAFGRAAIAWGWRAALSLALVYVGALAGDFVGGRGGGALWVLFFGHQLIVLGRAALRASWFANALRLVAR